MKLERRTYVLSSHQLAWLFTFYTALLLTSLAIVLFLYWQLTSVSIHEPLVTSTASATAGSAIAYSRRLYKSAMNARILAPPGPSRHAATATLVYFLTRPLFAAFLGLLVGVAIQVARTPFHAGPNSIDVAYMHASAILGFITGFSTGTMLTELDTKAANAVRRLVRKAESNP